MNKMQFFRLFALAIFCLVSFTTKSEQSFSKKKTSKVAISDIIVEPTISSYASYASRPLPYDDGYFIRI